jgi:hypothetical protein
LLEWSAEFNNRRAFGGYSLLPHALPHWEVPGFLWWRNSNSGWLGDLLKVHDNNCGSLEVMIAKSHVILCCFLI